MKPWLAIAFWIAALLCIATPTQAQTLPHIFSNPQVLPGPQIPESLVLRMAWTGCGSWIPESQVVTRTSNVVTVTQTISGLDSQCTGAGFVQFNLGVFPPGTYTLVYQADEFFTGIGTYPALSTQFTVGGGATPAAVDAVSQMGLAVLAVALLAVVMLRRVEG